MNTWTKEKRRRGKWQAAKTNEAAKPPVDLPTPWTPKIETTSMFAALLDFDRADICLLLPTGVILGLLLGLPTGPAREGRKVCTQRGERGMT